MGKSKKIIILALISFNAMSTMAAGKNSAPNDIPTIEALIDAHKKMKKAEDIAVVELSAITETHDLTSRLASRYNQTRTKLNQRLADVGSVVTLVSSLLSITQQLKNLTEDYAYFTETTYKNAQKHPYLILVYTNANAQLVSEIKHIIKSCADFSFFQTNVFKSTMEEKRQLLGFISMHIASAQRIISRATMICRSICLTGVKEYHVQDLINSKTNQELINKVINKWIQKAS